MYYVLYPLPGQFSLLLLYIPPSPATSSRSLLLLQFPSPSPAASHFTPTTTTTAIMIVPDFEEVLAKTSKLFPLPTTTATAKPTHVAPIPSVLPDTPIFEVAGDSGKKTLWVVFVLMVIASASFTALSWRVPVVRTAFITARAYH